MVSCGNGLNEQYTRIWDEISDFNVADDIEGYG